jgi:RES domain
MSRPRASAAVGVAAAAFDESYRIIAAHLAPPALLLDIAAPRDAEAVLTVMRLTGMDMDSVVGSLARVPLEDRPVGPGAGWALLAFTHPARASRFTDGKRGIWYGALKVDTAIAETAFHDERLLRAFHEPPQRRPKQVLRARLLGVMIDTRPLKASDPALYGALHNPDPTRYAEPQRFGAARHAAGDDGIVYDSVRHPPRGTCIAVLRPRAVRDAHRVGVVDYTWTGATLTLGAVRMTP